MIQLSSDPKKRKQLHDAAEEVECLVKSRRSSKKSRWGKIPTRIDDLPDALLVDILVRLPFESVQRCKSVSERWHSFISDPWFGRQIALPFTLVCEHPNPCHKEEFLATGSHGIAPFVSSVRGVRIVGASNDLLLYCFPDSSSPPKTERLFYVCNPFTKQHWMKLPALHLDQPYEEKAIGFVCEPRYKVTDDGRHVINSSYNYRVICTDLKVFKSSPSIELDVFFSETGQWSKTVVTVPPWFQFTPRQSLGIVCDAKLHWITATNGIFAYDPFADRCTLIDVPAELKGEGNEIPLDVRLGECRGRLRILRFLSTHDPQVGIVQELPPVLLTVWELKDYSAGEWCIVHDFLIDLRNLQTVGLDKYYTMFNSSFSDMAVVFHPFDVDIVYLWLPDDFIVCNLGSAEFQAKSASKNVIYHTSDMVFSLVEQLFPTPLRQAIQSKTSRSPILPDFQQSSSIENDADDKCPR